MEVTGSLAVRKTWGDFVSKHESVVQHKAKKWLEWGGVGGGGEEEQGKEKNKRRYRKGKNHQCLLVKAERKSSIREIAA